MLQIIVFAILGTLAISCTAICLVDDYLCGDLKIGKNRKKQDAQLTLF